MTEYDGINLLPVDLFIYFDRTYSYVSQTDCEGPTETALRCSVYPELK